MDFNNYDRLNSVKNFITVVNKNLNHLFIFFTAVFFSLFDLFSTLLCIETVGYEYEANVYSRQIIHSTGAFGFVVVKFSLAFLALIITCYIIENKDSFGWKKVKMLYGIYIGTIISSVFATISNLSVLYSGSSLHFQNLDSFQIATILLFIGPVTGLFIDIINWERKY